MNEFDIENILKLYILINIFNELSLSKKLKKWKKFIYSLKHNDLEIVFSC